MEGADCRNIILQLHFRESLHRPLRANCFSVTHYSGHLGTVRANCITALCHHSPNMGRGRVITSCPTAEPAPPPPFYSPETNKDLYIPRCFYLGPPITHSFARFFYNFLLSNFPPSIKLVSLLFSHYFLFLSCNCFIVSFLLFSFFGATAKSGYCRGILHPGHVIRPWTDG